ncbi:hypothetical protein GCM10011316_02720 [Roseibium aquae]|uniref:HTH marR-type domain-containing protein n=1 Tax=Roseibium aquae TaxID=1323746 RepID=A0A916T711_9HYPH|nr:MarR family transcriptional regulator [Roseibium aquae]GGB34077.1 hypothetical protein GCM10011316_02720 [Roseibium aquae]
MERSTMAQAAGLEAGEPAAAFVDNYLSYLLAHASHLVSTQFHAHLRRYGVQVPAWRLLATLSEGDGKTIGHLARISLYNQPTTTKIVDRLEAEGLAERRRCETDRRRMLVYITQTGRDLVDELLRDAQAHEKRVLDGYTSEEVTLLKNVLRTLILRLEDDG